MEKVHFNLTALRDFWGESDRVIYLGEWCFPFGIDNSIKDPDVEIIEGPYQSDQIVDEAQEYVKLIYEKSLTALGSYLNLLHGTRYSHRFWRIVIGPWLYHYIAIFYDRYLSISQVIKKYPQFETIALAKESYHIPFSTLDFLTCAHQDLYNLQIYSKILTTLGKTFTSKNWKSSDKNEHKYNSNFFLDLKGKALNKLVALYKSLTIEFSPHVLLKDCRFSAVCEIGFMIRFPLAVYRDRQLMSDISASKPSPLCRNGSIDIFSNDGGFGECISKIIMSDIPLCFIEGFAPMLEEARKNYPKTTKAVMSSTAWYHNESFKIWAADSAEGGMQLIGIQHGGNYGISAKLFSEDHELAILDRFYTWGWVRSDCNAKVTPFTAPNFIGKKKIYAEKNKKMILWGITAQPRYPIHISPVENFLEYLAQQKTFLSTLSSDITKFVLLRPHIQDYGWGIKNRLLEHYPSLKIDQWENSFRNSLNNCRLYICDHLSTTFIEAIVSGCPTIIFLNPRFNKLRIEAIPCYELLKKNGILYDSPEKAGNAINQIYADVHSWWCQHERQAAIKEFCKSYAKFSENGFIDWMHEIKSLVNNSSQTMVRD